MSTGNRCAIYDDIAALGEARTVADLVRRLQPILNELAYYGVTGETAVLEAHEEWRAQYHDSLRAESGGGAAVPPPPDSARARPSSSSRPAREPDAEPRVHSHSRAHPREHSREQPQEQYEQRAPSAAARAPSAAARAAPARTHTPAAVNASGVPRALLAIMSGSHPSFRD
jgi:hypothetical protein